MVCFMGCCIPETVLIPVILVILREIWYFFFGKPEKQVEKVTTKDEKTISSTEKSDNDSKTISSSHTTGYLGDLTADMNWDDLISSEIPTFVKFTANWCVPCKETAPIFTSIAEGFASQAKFVNVDIDEFDEIAANNKVISIPLILCYKQKKIIGRLSGKKYEGEMKKFVADCLSQ